jgi:hypothetical protein
LAVGGGYQVNAGTPSGTNNPGEVTVTQNQATSNTTWTVAAFVDNSGDVGTWNVTANVVCANAAP